MSDRKFLGARMEPEIFEIVDKVAEEEHIDRTAAIKTLVLVGWKEMRLEKAIENYRKGIFSIDKATKSAGLNVHQLMQEIASRGIKSEESIEEYKTGVKLLIEK